MKDVIVIVHATERKFLMDEYEEQLRTAGIDFHVEKIEPLVNGLASMTMRWRCEYWKSMCQKFSDYKYLIFTDAWDVMFFGARDQLILKLQHINYPLLSAERNCWPDPESPRSLNWSSSPWKFVNCGMMAGSNSDIIVSSEKFLSKPDLDIMDQQWMNRLLNQSGTTRPMGLDRDCYLFYTVSADKEDGSLTMEGDRIYNQYHDTFPNFFHFAGPCHPDPFRSMVRGEIESLKSPKD